MVERPRQCLPLHFLYLLVLNSSVWAPLTSRCLLLVRWLQLFEPSIPSWQQSQATENFSFSTGPTEVLKLSLNGSEWSALGHMLTPLPIIKLRSMQHTDWPGSVTCFTSEAKMGPASYLPLGQRKEWVAFPQSWKLPRRKAAEQDTKLYNYFKVTKVIEEAGAESTDYMKLLNTRLNGDFICCHPRWAYTFWGFCYPLGVWSFQPPFCPWPLLKNHGTHHGLVWGKSMRLSRTVRNEFVHINSQSDILRTEMFKIYRDCL